MATLAYFQTLTLLASVIALVVSFRVQRQLLRLQGLQEQLTRLQIAERQIQVRTEMKDEFVEFRPFLSEQDINSITIHFSAKFSLTPIVVAAPDLRVRLTRFAPSVRTFLDAQSLPMSGEGRVKLTAPVPAILEIHGHTKGVAVLTRAFYDVWCRYLRSPDGSSELEVRGLSLNNYLVEGQNIRLAIEQASLEWVVALAHSTNQRVSREDPSAKSNHSGVGA